MCIGYCLPELCVTERNAGSPITYMRLEVRALPGRVHILNQKIMCGILVSNVAGCSSEANSGSDSLGVYLLLIVNML